MAALWWNNLAAFDGVTIHCLLFATEVPLLIEQLSMFLWPDYLGKNNNLTV
jgi:hypothetical protein